MERFLICNNSKCRLVLDCRVNGKSLVALSSSSGNAQRAAAIGRPLALLAPSLWP